MSCIEPITVAIVGVGAINAQEIKRIVVGEVTFVILQEVKQDSELLLRDEVNLICRELKVRTEEILTEDSPANWPEHPSLVKGGDSWPTRNIEARCRSPGFSHDVN